MEKIFERLERLIGKDGLDKLRCAHIAVFGVGGVGGYVAEALARSGVGALTLIDKDTVTESNINRQVVAYRSTIGKAKTDVMRDIINDINPDCKVFTYTRAYSASDNEFIDFDGLDYIIDAIDDVDAKLTLIKNAIAKNVPIISVMGAGNKLIPQFEVADISKTTMCPLAKIMRVKLRAIGINHLDVVYSKQKPKKSSGAVGSIVTVVGTAGLLTANYVMDKLIKS